MMTNRMPTHEIWGNDTGSIEPFADRHREDCHSIEDARSLLDDWQTGGRSAHIRDKETGRTVS